MIKYIFIMVLLIPITGFSEEKHHEDPTKIITKLGAGYNDEATTSVSIGLDETKMVNANTNFDGSEWRVGGSWLFDFGIVNFNFNRVEYDEGSHKNSYSLGSFIPLSIFGFSPGGWQIFPMLGYNYSNGDVLTEQNSDITLLDGLNYDALTEGNIQISNSNHSGYLGAFAFKPLTEHFSLITVVGGLKGSDSYSGYWIGGGISYKINQQQSINVFGFVSDDDYGKRNQTSISYSYQFN